jgi:hypothetical protein
VREGERKREKIRKRKGRRQIERERERGGGGSIDGAFARVTKDVRCTHCFLECARQDRLGNFWEASNANKVIEALQNAVPGFSIKDAYQEYH